MSFNINNILGIELEPNIKETFFNLIFQLNYKDYYTIRTLILWIISLIIILTGIFSQKSRDFIGLTMLIMLGIVSFGGFFITYIYPRYVYVAKYNLTFKGWLLRTLDLFFHHAPLIIHIMLLKKGYWNYEPSFLMYTILINIASLILFVLFVNPFEIYMPALYYGKDPTQ